MSGNLFIEKKESNLKFILVATVSGKAKFIIIIIIIIIIIHSFSRATCQEIQLKYELNRRHGWSQAMCSD